MRYVLAVILFAGCNSSGGSGGADPSCATHAADLATWATTVDRTYGGGLMASEKLVEDRDASPVTLDTGRGSAIAVTHDAISVNGRPATDARAVAAQLLEAHLDASAGAIIVFLDRDAPLALVVTAVDGAVAAGARDVQLGVARPVAPLPPPPRSSVTDELAASAAGDPSQHATTVAHVLQRVIAGCPALVRAFATPPPGATSKAQAAIDALPALVECSCSIDLDALRSVLWVLLGPGVRPPAGLVRVTLAPGDDHDATIVTGATWADAAPAVFAAAAAGKPVRFVAPASR